VGLESGWASKLRNLSHQSRVATYAISRSRFLFTPAWSPRVPPHCSCMT
jgi:hypothetical protein